MGIHKKTMKNLFEQIVSWENLFLAFEKAYRACKNKNKYRYFYLQEKILLQIRAELLSGRYEPRPYSSFVVFEPKRREINAPNFYDRIIHHALCNIIEPMFDQEMINNSFACRKERGVHRAIITSQTMLKKHPFVLKGDIEKFFPSIDHKILFSLIERKIKERAVLDLIKKIISSYSTKPNYQVGLPIGNLTSQIFGNIYLNELDQYVLKKYPDYDYIRYLDDFLLFGSSKKELWIAQNDIENYLSKQLHLNWHNKKKQLFPFCAGLPFLGYIIRRRGLKIRGVKLRKTLKNFHILNKIGISNCDKKKHWSSWHGFSLLAKSSGLNKMARDVLWG